MFEEIEFNDLKIGKEYFITGSEIDVIYYKGIFEGHSYNSAKFHSLKLLFPFYMNFGDRAFHVCLKRYYYQFVSKKKEIQQNMETRAINKLLQTVTGDECFEW